MHGWSIRDSVELYSIANWGRGYLSVSGKGHLEVRPRGPDSPAVDLLALVQDLERRGLAAPLLVRFSDILASRVEALAGSFERAMKAYEYSGRFRGVYPIKVNQQRQVVEEIVAHGS